MPQYLLIITNPPGAGPAEGTPERMEQRARWRDFTEALKAAGAHRAGEALEPPETATTVRVRDGETLITDGPFAETREVLNGFYLIEVPTLDDALRWAAQMPNIHYGSVEVRPVMDFAAAMAELAEAQAQQQA